MRKLNCGNVGAEVEGHLYKRQKEKNTNLMSIIYDSQEITINISEVQRTFLVAHLSEEIFPQDA